MIFDNMKTFEVGFLDHVAIRVRDIEHSARWHENVLGLKRWGTTENGKALFMSCSKSRVAVFPANPADPVIDKQSNHTVVVILQSTCRLKTL
jgi:catechol 2,3-dioxygenase-like lactoylglutathione lyase family enzyme